ncbi:hypothetical protein COU54_01070 [Candidatus Pacearchaeota archaeon CG10_big_fil_rev_8_21_14_0_10_31_24]|nr:MAG: hypothetical protein COU54_01070 [Candidatus Pacearchaeota archaeon CG10_big_fil_rev_8_21_14_0_10_31_24]
MGDKNSLFLVCSVFAVSILLLSSVSAFSFSDWFNNVFGNGERITGNVVGSGGSGTTPSTNGFIKAMVYDSQETLITNAKVTLISSSNVEYDGIWDGRYLYAFEVPAGTYNLRVVAEGYDLYNHPSSLSVLSGPNNGPIITLSSTLNVPSPSSSSSSGGSGSSSSEPTGSSSSSSGGSSSDSPLISYSFDSSNDKLKDGASIVNSGVDGRAVSLDGINDYVETESVFLNNNAVTVMGWFKTDSLSSGGNDITGTWISSRDLGVILDPEPDRTIKMYVNLKGLGWYSASSNMNNIELGAWAHWVGTYDGSTIKVYKDGVLYGSKSISGELSGIGKFCIGKDCGISNRFFDGSVDEVKVYDVALSASKIKEIYDSEKGNLVDDTTSSGSGDSALCVDSDGGVNSKVSGWTDFTFGDFYLKNEDHCVVVDSYDSDGSAGGWHSDSSCSGSNCYVEEAYCKTDSSDNFIDSDATELIKCPSGCSNGACDLVSENSCSELISSGGEYPGNLADLGVSESNLKKGFSNDIRFFGADAEFYQASYENSRDDSVLGATIVRIKGDGADKVIQDYLAPIKERSIWERKSMLDSNGISQDYYVFYEPPSSKYYVWYKDNILVVLSSLSNAGPSQSLDAEEIITSLRNNNFKNFNGVGKGSKSEDTFLYGYLDSCSSDVSQDISCFPDIEQKVEPSICPESGYQNIIIRDLNKCSDWDGRNVIRDRIECSPGICSGCIVPRWMGYNNDDNVCIPYSTRLGFEKSDNNRIFASSYMGGSGYAIDFVEENDGQVYVNITSYEDYAFVREFKLYPYGEIYDVNIEGDDTLTVRIENINFVSPGSSENYADISVIEGFDAYCNYDGNVKRQKGDDATCQNNYECFSNECSAGYCVNTYTTVVKNAGLLKQIWCRMANIPGFGGTDEGYSQCLNS